MGIEIKEIDDRLEKQKDISKNFPELDAKEKGTLAGLDMPFNKEKWVTPEDVNKGMGARFDAEIAKAGNSSNKPELEKRKAELCKEIENTKDMKEKIALFQSFVDGLAPEVGTQIAEQKQRELQNTKSMEKEIKQDNDKKWVKKNPSTEEKGKDKEMIASIEKNPLTTFGKLSANILGNMVRDAIIDGQKDAMEGRKQLAKANQEIPPGDPEKEWPN